MQRQISGFVAALVVSAICGQVVLAQAPRPNDAPGGRPRLTTDKKELPPASAKFIDIKMSVIGSKLGALPEQVCSRLFAFESDVPMVQQTRREATKAGIDLDGFNYIGDGSAGFSRTALSVSNGRVEKVILMKPNLTHDAAMHVMQKIAQDSQSAPKKGGDNRISFKINNIRFYLRPVGSWQRVTAGESKAVVGLRSTRTEQMPDKKESGPGGIEIGFNEFDWKALNITSDPTKLDAILKGKILVGMNYWESYAAMRGFKCYRQKEGKSGQMWTWTKTAVDKEDVTIFSGDFDTFTTTKYTRAEKAFCRVHFTDGLVVTIEDEETITAPPAP